MNLPYLSHPENHIEILDTSSTLDQDKLGDLFQEAKKQGFIFQPVGIGGPYIDPEILNRIYLTISTVLDNPFVQAVLVETVVRFLCDKVAPFISNSVQSKFRTEDNNNSPVPHKVVPTIVITHGDRSLTITDPSEESIVKAIHEFFHPSDE